MAGGMTGPTSNGEANGGNRFAAADDFKELVRQQTDLVGLIGEKVRLQSRRGGRDYIGLCPFHDDSKPSFHVYPERNSYRCWACQEGGDCFEFVMKTERLDFREALESLARRAGLELPTYGRGNRQNAGQKDRVIQACDWAAKQFAASLPKCEAAAAYIAGRGFSAAIIEQFQIGYHPDDWTWVIDRARSRNIPIETLAEAKLINKSQRTGDWLDYFVGRVVFPIRNERGQTVAFGGRVLPGDDERGPKYFNTPETPYFSKSRLLFGLDVARRNLEQVPKGETRRAVVVEGYTDCVTLHQYGLGGAVGVLGTALTEFHGRLLARFADQVVLVFDGDTAGQNAAARSVSTMLASELDVRVLVLPDNLDPDEYLKANGRDSLEELLDEAAELWDWRVKRSIATHGVGSITARERVATELIDTLYEAGLKSGQMRTESLLRSLERPLSISLQTLVRQFDTRTAQGNRNAEYRQAREQAAARPVPNTQTRTDAMRVMSGRATKDDRMEAELLQGLLHRPEEVAVDRLPLAPEDFTNTALGRLYRASLALAQKMQPQSSSYEHLLAILTVSDLKQLLVFLDDERRSRLESDDESDLSPRSNETADEIPSCVARPLGSMLRRREEQSSQQISRDLPAQGQAASRMSDSEDALRRIAEFHSKRADVHASSNTLSETPIPPPAPSQQSGNRASSVSTTNSNRPRTSPSMSPSHETIDEPASSDPRPNTGPTPDPSEYDFDNEPYYDLP